MTHIMFSMQDNDFIVCEGYCIVFIEYILSGKMTMNRIAK